MKKYAFLIMLVIFAAACSKPSTGSALNGASSTANKATAAPSSDATQAKFEASDAENKLHDEFVKQFHAAFAPNSNWESSLNGSNGGPICQLRDRFDNMTNALQLMQNGIRGRIEWKDVSIEEGEAKKILKDTATQYAAEINKILSLDHAQRTALGSCGAGEGSLEMVDANMMTKYMVEALKSYGGSLADIGTTTEKLRTHLLEDYAARIKMARQESTSDNLFDLNRLIREAVYDWNFTPSQLKITAKEVEAADGR